MTTAQQGDLLLRQTADGGDITVEDGYAALTGTFETAAYLSLFGGNDDDDGRLDNPRQWWGNFDEPDTNRQQRSETQHLLIALEPRPGNLRRVEDAAKRDLNWVITERAASSVTAAASMPGVNRVKITITIEARGEREQFAFFENWEASQ